MLRAVAAAVLLLLHTFAVVAQLGAADYALPGPFQAGWRTVTVTRPDSSTFTAVLYYPAVARGLGAAFDPSGGPYPGVTFGHGFLQPVSRYASTLEHLATWGYFAIASESQSGLFPSHSAFADDMRHCLTWLEQQAANPASPYFQAVRTDAFGASGHSMGGGCSILAASRDMRIRAVANLAPAETNPSAAAAMPLVTVPLRLLAGSNDTVTPLGQHAQPIYNAGGPAKQLPVFQGGWHCGFQDSSSFGCDSGPMPRAEQLTLTRRYLTGFFELHLRGAQAAWRQAWGPVAESNVTTQAAPGASVLPSASLVSCRAGESASLQATLQNTGRAPTALTLLLESPFQRVLTVPTLGVLAVGAGLTVPIAVRVPSGTQSGDYPLLLSVRRKDDGARGYAAVTVRVTQ
ncbi:MAG: alpha/beta hydrolase [Fimbriimonadaceae bacterium]